MKGAVIKRYFFLFLAALFLSLHLALPVLAYRTTVEAKMAQSPAFAREMMRSFGPSAPSGFASSNAARTFGVLGAGGMIAFLAPTPTANSNLNDAIRRYHWSLLRVRVDVIWSFDSNNVLQFDTFELVLNPVHYFEAGKCGDLRSACFYYWQPRSCEHPEIVQWGPARVYGSWIFPATIQSFTPTVLERIPQPTGCPLTPEQQNGSELPNGELAPFFDPTNLVDVGPMAPPEEAPSGVPDGVPVINPEEGDNNIVPFIRPNTPSPPTTTTTTTNTPPPPTTTTTDTPPPTTTTTDTPPPTTTTTNTPSSPTTTTTNTPSPPTTTTTNTPSPPTTTTTNTPSSPTTTTTNTPPSPTTTTTNTPPSPTTTTTNTPPSPTTTTTNPGTTTDPGTTTTITSDSLTIPSINPIEPRTFNRPNFLAYAIEKFSNKFPFDIFGTPPPSVDGSECPSYTFFGQTTELCVVRDLIAIMKYPVIIGFAISMYKFL